MTQLVHIAKMNGLTISSKNRIKSDVTVPLIDLFTEPERLKNNLLLLDAPEFDFFKKVMKTKRFKTERISAGKGN